MSPLPLAVALTLVVFARGAAAAGQEPPPTPNPSPVGTCGGCPGIDRRLQQIEDELRTLDDRLRNIRDQQRTLGNSIRDTAGEMVKQAGDVGRDPGAADALGRNRTKLQGATGQLRQLNDAFRRTIREESVKALEAINLRKQKEECRKACPDAHTGKANTTGGATGTATSAAPSACQDCPRRAEDLKTKRDQLNKLREELSDKLLEMGMLGLSLQNGASQLGKGEAADREIRNELRPSQEAYINRYAETTDLEREIGEKAAEVEAAESALEDCDKACPPPTPISRSFVKPLTYAGGGAIAVGTLLLADGGGNTPPAVNVVPTTGPTTVATPPEAPAPPPPVTTPPVTQTVGSPDGTHMIAACECINNQAAMDADILFCQRVAQLLVAAAIFGNMRIVGGDPVLPGEGSFNTTTGAFDFSATGHVGGVGTVTLRYTGTIDREGNLVATITYTRNGRTTIYRVSTRRGR